MTPGGRVAALLLTLRVALCTTIAAAQQEQSPVRIAEPVAVVAAEDVAAEWTSFAVPPLVGPTRIDIADAAATSRVRLDVLVRRSGEWRVDFSGILDSEQPTVALPRGERIALLARFEGVAGVYGWAEVERVRDSIPLQLLRNIRVLRPSGADVANEPAVLFSHDVFPLRYENGVAWGVPLLAGLLCAGDSCARVSADDSDIALSLAGPTRVIRVDSEGADLHVLSPGSTPQRPRVVAAEVVPYGEWSAVTLPPGDLWTSTVVDVVSDGALVRALGSELLSLPAFTDIYAAAEKGVTVRPLIGPDKTPHSATAARLFVFGSPGATGGFEIPLAVATLDENGVFVLPELGSGRYRFKMFSSEATGEVISADVMAGLPVDVVFARGPLVRGRVLRQSGGTPNDSVIIEVARQTPVGDDMSQVGDWIRRGVAAADGEFHITLTTLGPYRLRATWGTAHREVDFVLKDMKKDVNVGTITLDAGASVSGKLLGCVAGELRFIPLPDLEQPAKIGFFDLRKVPIAADGAFAVNGLAQGDWLLDATCEGVQTAVQPSLVRVPETGAVFIDLVLARPTIDQ